MLAGGSTHARTSTYTNTTQKGWSPSEAALEKEGGKQQKPALAMCGCVCTLYYAAATARGKRQEGNSRLVFTGFRWTVGFQSGPYVLIVLSSAAPDRQALRRTHSRGGVTPTVAVADADADAGMRQATQRRGE